MGVEDEFSWLEDLSDSRTLRFVEEMNGELRRFLGGLPGAFRGYFTELLSRHRVYSISPDGSGGIYMLYKGSPDILVHASGDGGSWRVLAASRGDEVYRYVERVDGTHMIALHVSVAGADEGIVKLYKPDGPAGVEVRGSVWGFMSIGGELYYVRFYRRGRTPDGVEAPAERVVRLGDDGEEVVWGAGLQRGLMIDASYHPEGGLVAYTVREGWRRSWLHIAGEGDPGDAVEVVGGDALYTPVGWLDGFLAVLRLSLEGDELLAVYPDGSWERLARLERPAERAATVAGYAAVVSIVDGRHRLDLYDSSGERVWSYEPPEPTTIDELRSSGGTLYLLETSFTTPYRVEKLDPKSGAVSVVAEAPWRVEARVTEFWVRSRDGTTIHSWLVTPAHGRARAVVLYGYGGFNLSQTPRYHPFVEALLSQGIAFAVANIRGGREEGERWHVEGMLKNKHRVFEDYAAVAEHLESLGVKVAGWGASNGGLLIGAVETRWPHLLDAALIGYPVLDMLRYHKLYIGRIWVPEYGDPDDPEMRSYLLSYSPYHNIPPVTRAKLPPTLVYTGLHDDRVHPAHALKYVARARKLGQSNVYLRVETRSGHSGATAETRAEEYADMLAFLLKTLGLQPLRQNTALK